MSTGSTDGNAGGAGDGSKKKGGPLKWILIIGGIFAVLCVGLCGGVVAIGMLMPDGPTSDELAKLPDSKLTLDQLVTALPSLKDGSMTSRTSGARERRKWTTTIGSGTITTEAWAWQGTIRQVEIEATAPSGDAATRPVAQMMMYLTMSQIDPTYTVEHTDEYNTFAAGNGGGRDFGAMHVAVDQGTHAGDARTTYRLTMLHAPTAGPAVSAGPGNPPAPTPAVTPAPAPAAAGTCFKTTVAELEEAIPLLKEAGHTDATDHGVAYRTWSEMEAAGHKHTVTAWGPADQLNKVVVLTHIANEEGKLIKMAGMILTFSLMQRLDPALKADEMEGFLKWSFAAGNGG
ncbi:MAG TPA: hypothetical protein VL860_06205, partial [Planctomycetota bacterium]|nr:hypothetical protein [Planctomycetota bacterium]